MNIGEKMGKILRKNGGKLGGIWWKKWSKNLAEILRDFGWKKIKKGEKTK